MSTDEMGALLTSLFLLGFLVLFLYVMLPEDGDYEDDDDEDY